MDFFQAILLALIQGFLEFLPISSSAHLILLPLIFDWPDQGLAFDVALNTATLLAVIVYFRRDMASLTKGFFGTLKGQTPTREGRLSWMLLVATMPVAIAGLVFRDQVAGPLRSAVVIAWASILWGIMLFIADRRRGKRTIMETNWLTSLLIGIAQAIAIIPGTSRSGITITAGLFSNMSRPEAARFSFLLAIPVGVLAGGKEALELLKSGMDTPWAELVAGFIIAFVTAYITIHFFLKYITHAKMTPFVVYRVLLGITLLWTF